MRKSSYLSISEAKDRDGYLLLLNCNCCLHSQLKEYVSENRIKSYLHAKLIEKIAIQDRFVYRLTDKGYREFSREIQTDNFRYHSNSLEHDIALAQRYIDVHRQDSGCIWRNEQDLKRERADIVDNLREQGRHYEAERFLASSVPDCTISMSNGISYGFDITTENYTSADIQLKEDFCTELQMDFHYERI